MSEGVQEGRKPAVTVMMPTYNQERFVGDAVASVRAQTFEDWELIVVDDGSTDGTAEAARKAGDGRVRVLTLPHGGLSRARNIALREARGELMAFCDNDDLWDENKLEIQVPYLRAHPDIGLLYADAREFNEQGILRNSAYGAVRPPTGWCSKQLFRDNFICILTVLARTHYVRATGGFLDSIVAVSDYDLWLQMSRLCQFDFIPEVVAWHRRHGRNISLNQVIMAEGDLQSVEHFLERYPEVVEEFGQQFVNDRLFGLHFDLAYKLFDAGSLREARRHFRQALRYRPGDKYTRALWLLSNAPLSVVGTLRRAKRTIFPGSAKRGK